MSGDFLKLKGFVSQKGDRKSSYEQRREKYNEELSQKWSNVLKIRLNPVANRVNANLRETRKKPNSHARDSFQTKRWRFWIRSVASFSCSCRWKLEMCHERRMVMDRRMKLDQWRILRRRAGQFENTVTKVRRIRLLAQSLAFSRWILNIKVTFNDAWKRIFSTYLCRMSGISLGWNQNLNNGGIWVHSLQTCEHTFVWKAPFGFESPLLPNWKTNPVLQQKQSEKFGKAKVQNWKWNLWQNSCSTPPVQI